MTITGKPKPSGGGGYGSEHIKNYAQKNGITDPTELAIQNYGTDGSRVWKFPIRN